jgi:hypothetical protein
VYVNIIADTIYSLYLVTGNTSLVRDSFDDLVANYKAWETARFDNLHGLYWQIDDRDGMEMSICGQKSQAGYRVTINSYQIADANAISLMAVILGKPDIAKIYKEKADALLQNMTRLWDASGEFFKVVPRSGTQVLCATRELHGYTPWAFFDLSPEYDVAWKFLMSSDHFYAPFGPTTAEQCDLQFSISYTGHECQWNGPSWPYSTSVTLRGLANLINRRSQEFINERDYYGLLIVYSRTHSLTKDDGTTVPWIDEDVNPLTGDWIARTMLKPFWPKQNKERGKDYCHSAFCDHIITGLIGIRPQEGNELTVNPLVPKVGWDYFCLEEVDYRNHRLTVLYDKYGSKYNQGSGLMVFVDGELKGKRDDIGPIKISGLDEWEE